MAFNHMQQPNMTPYQMQQSQIPPQPNVIQPNGHVSPASISMNGDFVTGEQYRYALTNFRIAHEKVESQRKQLEEQERQVAQLRQRITTLEGGDDQTEWQRTGEKAGGSSVDDFSIKNAASQLEKSMNLWAAEVVRHPPVSLERIRDAAFSDISGTVIENPNDASPMVVQSMLRHVLAETISEGVVNCLIVTNSHDANLHLTHIHEHLFDRDPTVACVWRRQTFTAAVESCSPEMSELLISEHMPSLAPLLTDSYTNLVTILDSAYAFSRMLHGSKSTSGGTVDAFYRAFVSDLGAVLFPLQNELIKRCVQSERGGECRVGASVFPGLVKVTRGGQQTVVRRARVICECALGVGSMQ